MVGQFWMEKWTELLFSSFPIPQVPSMIKIKTSRSKNKVCKSQGAIRYLTQNFIKNPYIHELLN
jgi:hypothetical protein